MAQQRPGDVRGDAFGGLRLCALARLLLRGLGVHRFSRPGVISRGVGPIRWWRPNEGVSGL